MLCTPRLYSITNVAGGSINVFVMANIDKYGSHMKLI